MEEFYGVYRGFTPTDESAIGIGEMELTLSKDGLKLRVATGLSIQEESVPLEQFVQMTPEEVSAEYNPGSNYPSRTIGFQDKENFIPKLLFIPKPAGDDFGLVVRLGEMSSILGPTLLYSPAQIEAGKFRDFLENIKGECGDGVFPLLASGGKS
jgi:hypothetical protein